MTLVKPVPKPVFKRNRSCTEVPLAVKQEVISRSLQRFPRSWITLQDEERGLCEAANCPNPRGEWRGLHFAHRFNTGQKNKGMGGAHRIPTADDIWRACAYCHTVEDHGGMGCC